MPDADTGNTSDNILFQQNSDIFSAITAESISWMQLIDIDSDADLDFIYHGNDSQKQTGIFWHANYGTNETPLFASSGINISKSFSQAAYIPQVRLGDFDLDGDVDALVQIVYPYQHYTRTDTFWQKNHNASEFGYAYIGDSDIGIGAQFVDYDGDGDLDAYGTSQNQLQINRNTAEPGQFAVFDQWERIDFNSRLRSVSFWDINNDGILEMYEIDRDGKLYTYLNSGTSENPVWGKERFTLSENLPSKPNIVGLPSEGITTFSAGDLDNDSDTDVIMYIDGDLRYFENKTPKQSVFNKPPDELTVSTLSLDENIAAGSTVASLSTSDPNPGDTHTYSLVIGDGDVDNSNFSIDGDQLKVNQIPDYETKSSYSVRIQTKDSGDLSFEKVFTLTLNDVNDPPWSLSLTNTVNALPETIDTSSRIKVADIAITDDVLGSNVVTLGGADSASFEVDGAELFFKAGTDLDYERQAAYAVTVSASDSTLTGSKPVTADYWLAVNDIAELPVIQSINSVKIKRKVATFALIKPLVIKEQNLHTAIIGSNKKDKITGSSKNEILAGFKGKDVLKGGDGADGFLFDKPIGFGKKQMDKILDFDSEELDKILVDRKAFGLGRKIKFRAVNRKSQLKKASRTKVDFIYENKTGLLFFNENGKKSGFGDGGLFAQLKGKPELFADDFRTV